LPANELNQASVTVTGWIGDPDDCVVVNGVSAHYVDDNGDWEADRVPVSPTGTANLLVQAFVGDPALIAAQMASPPQPPKVVLASYSGTQAEQAYDGSGWEKWTINWVHDSGGTADQSGYNDNWEDPADYYESSQTSFPADGQGYAPPIMEAKNFDISGTLNWDYFSVNTTESDGATITGSFQRSSGAQIMIAPAGQQAAGITNVYLVLLSASEFSKPVQYIDSGYGDLPLPPQWLQYHGQPLLDTGITNANGEVWGATTVQALAGTTPIITPTFTHFYNNAAASFNAQAVDITHLIAVDANRDGQIALDGSDDTSAAKPYRFWVNDNHDGLAKIWNLSGYDLVQEDLDPSTGNDATSNTISCTRDLEDYTRLWLNIQSITNELQNGTFILGLQWEDTVGNPAIRIFAAVETNGGTLYLTDTNIAQAQITAPFGTNIVGQNGQQTVTIAAPFLFNTNFWSNCVTNPVTYLLFDGVSSGNGKLVPVIYKNDGVTKLAEGRPLFLSLNEITDMYERWTVGEGNGGAPASTPAVFNNFQYTAASPEANQYILFVHGWNVSPQVKDDFANTAYKRLWWQGYQGRFGEFRWPTLYNFPGWQDQGLNLRNFDDSESNAWASATGLASLLTDLNVQYGNSVYVFAHSHGNIVVGEALRLLGSNQTVNTYVGCQAAVPAHAYDPSTTGWETTSSTPDSFASYPSAGAPCYFNGVTSAATRADFYNVNDWALNIWVLNQRLKPDHGITSYPGYYYSTTSGYYKIIGGLAPIKQLTFPPNTYEIFAYCVQSPCYALGATTNVNGFTPENMPGSLWPPDTFGKRNYGDHCWHSAEFLFSAADQWNFWKGLLGQQGFDLK